MEKPVGTEKNSVGRYRSMTGNTCAGVGGPGHRIVVAPTENGKYSALPRPYAKNSFATLKQRSLSRMPRTPLPKSSAQTTMSCCKWTHPFGAPVLPDEYSQNAGASRLVGSASHSSAPRATTTLNTVCVCVASPLPTPIVCPTDRPPSVATPPLPAPTSPL